MNQNKRTILLGAGALSVILLYGVDSGYRAYIEKPTLRYEAELASVESKLADANTSQITGRRLANQLEDLAARALPYDPALARSSYQDWLLGLVAQHRMESASVNADTPRPIEIRSRTSKRKSRLVGYRIGYNLRARTTLTKLTDFLHDFHHSGQLHKIRSFSLSPLVNGKQLDLSLSIETMSLQATEREGQLSPIVRSPESFPSRDQFDEFVSRNLFAKGFSKSLGQVRLNAITQNRDGTNEAWFAVGSPPTTQIIHTGEVLDIPLHSVKVIGVGEERAELLVNDFACWISLGQTLATVLGDPAVVETTTPAIEDEPTPSSPSDLIEPDPSTSTPSTSSDEDDDDLPTIDA